jgi:hypothetical protein
MSKVETPLDSSWESDFLWVCLNDDCTYYVEGWAWMMEKYQVHASYRHRIDPTTGQAGPLPVRSPEHLKSHVVDDTVAEDVND